MTARDTYSDALLKAHRAESNLIALRESLEKYCDALRKTPHTALRLGVQEKWPEWPYVLGLLQSGITAWDEMQRTWNMLTPDEKKREDAPLKAIGSRQIAPD